LITNKLREKVATYIKDNLDGGKVGTGGNSTSPASTSLDVDTGVTPSFSIVKTDENVIEVKVTVEGSTISGKVLRELGLFDGTEMWARYNFEGVGPFSNSEIIEFFVIMEVE
jgi:hypothetical protein